MPGHIRRRSARSWTVIVDLGRDSETGRRRQVWRSVKGPKREAKALLVSLLHDRDAGIDQPPSRLSVAAYLERWLQDYVQTNTAPKTYDTYRMLVRIHLSPPLGHLVMTALRPGHIQALYSRLLTAGRSDGSGGLSPRSVLRIHQVLHAALRQAVRWQLLVRNPADAVEPPRAPRRELTTLGPEDARRVFAAADQTDLGPFVRLAVLTGLRRGELLGLRWRDVDIDTGNLHVQQSAQRLTGRGIVFAQPKTPRSRRAVALSVDATDLLRGQRRRQVTARLRAGSAYEDRDLVFATALGTPLEPGNVLRSWHRIRSAAGFPRLRLHDLRHAHATLMLAAGVHPKIVSERLGHASVGITLDTYSHVLPGLQAAAAERLDAILAGADPESAARTG